MGNPVEYGDAFDDHFHIECVDCGPSETMFVRKDGAVGVKCLECNKVFWVRVVEIPEP
jgi:uncharacterized Zn finger protein